MNFDFLAFNQLGFFNPSWFEFILIALLLTHITIVGVTVYLHRHSAHRSLELATPVKHFFRFWLWLTTGMNTKAWTAIHRKHHALCDQDGDPHSPVTKGIKKVFTQGAELYDEESKNKETLEKYGRGTPDDWMERNLYTPYKNYGILLMFIIDVACFGFLGLTMWAIQMFWIPFFAAGVVNGIGHWWGYRNFESKDASTNISPIGLIIGGEELHNNHHTYPLSAKLSVKKWEFDIGWGYIKLLSFFGLATVKNSVPKEHLDAAKSDIDLDTVRALMHNRFQVLANYRKNVIMPLVTTHVEQTSSDAKATLRRVKGWFTQDQNLLDDQKVAQMEKMYQENPTLNQAIVLRDQLKGIWEKTQSSSTEMVQALNQWCKEAEESGIKALEEFAQRIRNYTIQPATAAAR
ncbi:MAG TPA: acyl-CoA desaturase [Gammaproteobacteria bacterium]|nr:acyl-CoA desaturase [Gammaproteobacteria bacterium]MEC8011690.1 fatty acid desaturase [Pseudomonadota bacterium]HBF08231.1 acyl-CoA desaturase [Gammaproteobacteria bacterium]HCK94104.1 acyl-CoA desaturase [Gammaproteobacteria bacterium]